MSQNPLSVGTDYETLANRFRPQFRQIAAGTVEREQARDLPFEPIRWLKEAGFGAVRVPVEFGGAGASISQLFQLLIELAEADSNIVQSLRGHFAFVEDRLNAPPSPARDAWFARFVAGDLVGNGWTEIGAVKIGEVITKVRPEGENFVLNGAKYYSTGSIFADWVDVYAQRSDNGADVIAIVDARHSGVSHSDDWDGFGQRTTGSGTSLYVEVPLSAEQVIPFETRFKYQTAFYQLVLLAVLAGIGRAVERDVANEVRTRKRVFSQGSADTTHGDPQIQQVVGQISAQVYAAEAATLRSAEPLQRAYLARFANDAEAERQANIDAEIETSKAQVVVSELVLRATTDLFNALGASGVSINKSLDRHWRNARTAASHNPWIFKARIIGDWVVNGIEPKYVWQIGNSVKS
ncbi:MULTISPECIES: acyl-CoA dehydrogenase family protein [unclassified Pseudomonas]|uniref:acyl-CoA dehydrogenase family protein n=1 Tax=unclassified Pseudomonas TaxID=196821 RepID=UPI0012952B0A|nr:MULTISPECIES: acyl-CoA dehydrogenase family protein [unclassified Pseudomonas]MQT42486.1 monooxygenase [Pseudomonas sp. FSL R10-0765]MQT54149.1 monooxygenase [Pseudomonas sp. FSL R10-2398]MQU02227.1 monooxygenase [Pseudomonas sp. FSL R10-2245]MQU11933.1 monooxygenase [Pseudomonas sp. FSL R10-2189]MQU39760.1 monooxygenase [Pseudomonas sp. FSL R10-2172]